MVYDVMFKKLFEDAIIPSYTREADACLDLKTISDILLFPGETEIAKTGLAVQLPPNTEGRIRGRSGLAAKGIHVHHGTIDEEYRGEIGIIITNTSNTAYRISPKDRIAQFSINPVYKIKVLVESELENTSRGAAGFGSSGK